VSTVQAIAGTAQDVPLPLTQTEAPPTTTAVADIGAPDSASHRNYAPALIVGGVGVAAAATGIGLLIAAGSKSSERDDRLAALPDGNPCASGTPYVAECAAIHGLDDDARTFRTVAYVSFGVTAAAAVTTFILWPRKHHPDTAFVILPSFGDRQLALTAHTRF
jgi:hypothetical protein